MLTRNGIVVARIYNQACMFSKTALSPGMSYANLVTYGILACAQKSSNLGSNIIEARSRWF